MNAEEEEYAAEQALRDLVSEIGLGFHLDHRVGDYSPPLPRAIRARYEDVIEDAFRLLEDPYAIAWDEMRRLLEREPLGWEEKR